MMRSIFVLLFWIICGVQIACAQELVFMAQSSSGKVGLQSRFQISFTLQNAPQINQLKVPAFTDFVVVGGPMQSSSFSTINGSSSSSVSYTYYLQPKAIGTFTIQPATAIVDGKAIKSNAIAIEVIKGGTNNAQKNKSKLYQDPFDDPIFNDEPIVKKTKKAAKNISTKDLANKVFARVDVDKTKAYQGEQITASFNVYSQLPLEAGFKKLMSPQGFWCQDYTNGINPQACERVMENGKEYRKYTLRKVALFATKAGDLEIPSVDIETNVETGESSPMSEEDNSIGSFLNQLFDGEQVMRIPLSLSTAPVKIVSVPLPNDNVPQNFSQNVGQYTIEGNIDKTEITTDETCVLQFTISGNGNIKLISSPIFSIPGDFESTEPVVSDTITNSSAEMQGYKLFRYTLSPRNAGDLHLPPASFCYFDPQTNTYETITTPAYNIKVKPGKNILHHPSNRLPQDIHDIVNDDTMQRNVLNCLPEYWLYWLGYLIPILVLLGISIYQKRKTFVANNSENIKNKHAKNSATQRLAIAQEMLKDNNKNGFYNETSKAIWLYLSDKLSIPLSKLNKEDTWELLEQEGLPTDVQQSLQHILQQCEENLYAVGGNNAMQQTYNDTVQMIAQLEKHFIA
jgi:BatD DUF11 like domain